MYHYRKVYNNKWQYYVKWLKNGILTYNDKCKLVWNGCNMIHEHIIMNKHIIIN